MINGAQCTRALHVDDVKVSHKDKKVVRKIIQEMLDDFGEIQVTRDKRFKYLGIIITILK